MYSSATNSFTNNGLPKNYDHVLLIALIDLLAVNGVTMQWLIHWQGLISGMNDWELMMVV